MSGETKTTFFAPQLLIGNGVTDISFYEKAFGATEYFCLRNDDNSVHVAELDINGAVFHLHEVTKPFFAYRKNTMVLQPLLVCLSQMLMK